MKRLHFDYGSEVSVDDNLILWPKQGNWTAVVDGDMLPYIIGYTIKDMDFIRANTRVDSGQVASLADTPECMDACNRLNALLNSWVAGAGCDAARIYLTDSSMNFRVALAFSKQYKGGRKADKPPFFYEMRQHLIDVHGAVLAQGEEADDLMSIDMWADHRALEADGVEVGSDTHKAFSRIVLCSKDKDLFIVPGWHAQDDGPPVWTDALGELWPQYKTDEKSGKERLDKLKGCGLKFFYSQLICGDNIDNYAGIPRKGNVFALELLDKCKTEKELYTAVLGAYKGHYGDGKVLAKNYRGGSLELTAYHMMLEIGRLAHMQTRKGEVWREKSYLPSGEDKVWLAK